MKNIRLPLFGYDKAPFSETEKGALSKRRKRYPADSSDSVRRCSAVELRKARPTDGIRTHNHPLKRRSNRILLSGYLFRSSLHERPDEPPADSLSFGVCPVPGLGDGGFEPLLIFFRKEVTVASSLRRLIRPCVGAPG